MFKQRLLATLCLVPLVLLSLYVANIIFFKAIVIALSLICGYEWLQLIPLKTTVQKLTYLIALLLFTQFILYSQQALQPVLITISLNLWVMLAVLIIFYPKSQKLWGYKIVLGLLGWLLLLTFASSLIGIFQIIAGKKYLVYLLCLVWATDIGAYMVGKQWGKHKLIPQVSPGKTLEGLTGGVICSFFMAAIAYLYFPTHHLASWLMLAMAVSVYAVIGDLLISMLKRRVAIKDTGYLIPGHGGILDRLDSLIAASPLFYWGLSKLLN